MEKENLDYGNQDYESYYDLDEEDFEKEKEKLLKRAKKLGLDIEIIDRNDRREVEVIKEKDFLSPQTKKTLTTASIAAAAAIGAVLGADDDMQDSSTMQIINGFATSYTNARTISRRIKQQELQQIEQRRKQTRRRRK